MMNHSPAGWCLALGTVFGVLTFFSTNSLYPVLAVVCFLGCRHFVGGMPR
jgi:hypothetical protein